MAVEELVWEFFRIDPMYVSGNFLTDALNLIILPTIVLLIFIEFAASLFLRDQHSNLKHLLSMAFYLMIVVQGFYASFTTFAKSLMWLFLMLAFGLFFFTRFITRGELGSAVSAVASGPLAKKKVLKDRLKEKSFLENEKKRLHNDRQAAQRAGNHQLVADIDKELTIIQQRLNQVNYDISRL